MLTVRARVCVLPAAVLALAGCAGPVTNTPGLTGPPSSASPSLGPSAPPIVEPVTMEPHEGPPGTHVRVRIVAIEAFESRTPLVMWLPSPGTSVCGPAQRYELGVVTWDGLIGTADVVVPEVPPGEYRVQELLGGGIACRNIGTFTVT